MLHAISMPQPASALTYVRSSLLVSLTPIKFESCGQPLPPYPAPGYEMLWPASDRRCRSGTESGDPRSVCGKFLSSGGLDDCLVDQQDRQAIPYRIHPAASRAFQGLGLGSYFKRIFAGGTNHQIEQLLGNHDGRLYDGWSSRGDKPKCVHPRGLEDSDGKTLRAAPLRFPAFLNLQRC